MTGNHRGLALITAIALAACAAESVSPSTGPSHAPSPIPGASPAAAPSPTATPYRGEIPPGRIVAHRLDADEVERYFTINTDGSDETAVYEAQGCSCAHLSADGSQILTIGPTGHGTWSLMTLNLDGSDKVVVEPPSKALNLFVGATSADGRVLAFNGMDEANPEATGLWIASPELTDARLVTPLDEGMLAIEPFGVTPDGSKIAFFAETGSEGGMTHAGDVYVVNADGSGLRKLNLPGPRTGYMGMPVISLSPDGKQAAFGLDNTIWVVDLEGGEAEPIIERTGFVWAVQWSPTGEWLNYTRFHGPTSVVALVRPDGSDDHEISKLDETDEANAATWSPDGNHLLVSRDSDATRDGPYDLWIMDLEGTWVSQVTNEPGHYGTYWWAPARQS
jgi:Tol biopolymer transport system component